MKNRVTDLATLIGVACALLLVMASIMYGGGFQFKALLSFIDIPSIFIVVGGTFTLTMACFSVSEILQAQPLVLRTVFYRSEDLRKSVLRSLEVAEMARKATQLLDLDKHASLWNHNPFLKKGLRLLIDAVPIEQVVKLLQHDILAMAERHANGISIMRKSAELAPAMGLIGTLIGLVQMLGNLEEPSTIGPAMAVALITTFYGAMLAYMFFTPLASKLERNSKAEIQTAKIYIKTIESIAAKENPRQLEAALNGMLPPSKRVHHFS